MAPAGSYEALQAAVQAGADAVYFGVGQLNMRSKSAANFTPDDLERIVGIARAAGVKSYLTVNTVIYEDELRQMHALVDRARAAGVDAVIASDLSAILYARRIGMEVHISTQCNLTNSEAVKFFSQWADVVVLARELSLDQIGRIARAIDEQQICGPSGDPVRIEMFAHGALCMAVSGKCYLSLHETGCSANRGACRQICRRKYTLTDVETGAQLAAEGQYLLSPKDSARSTSSTASSAPACACSKSKGVPAVRSTSDGWWRVTTAPCGRWRRANIRPNWLRRSKRSWRRSSTAASGRVTMPVRRWPNIASITGRRPRAARSTWAG